MSDTVALCILGIIFAASVLASLWSSRHMPESGSELESAPTTNNLVPVKSIWIKARRCVYGSIEFEAWNWYFISMGALWFPSDALTYQPNLGVFVKVYESIVMNIATDVSKDDSKIPNYDKQYCSLWIHEDSVEALTLFLATQCVDSTKRITPHE